MQEKEEIIILDNEVTPPVVGTKTPPVIEEDKILGKDGVWKKSGYIIGRRTTDDKKYCEKVSPLDLYSSIEIRDYILAVEEFLTKKENQRSLDESKNRVLKYLLCYGLGVTSVLWALYAGMINFTN